MSNQQAGTPTGDELQFERAERTSSAAALSCGVCKQAITASYYEINGHVACQRCRSRLVVERNQGSSAGRFARALGLGLGAALFGAGLYFELPRSPDTSLDSWPSSLGSWSAAQCAKARAGAAAGATRLWPCSSPTPPWS